MGKTGATVSAERLRPTLEELQKSRKEFEWIERTKKRGGLNRVLLYWLTAECVSRVLLEKKEKNAKVVAGELIPALREFLATLE